MASQIVFLRVTAPTRFERTGKLKKLFLSAFVILALSIFLVTNPVSAEEKLKVYVSIPPQSYFVKAIGGGHVDISVVVQSEESPASYEPSPKQMVKLARSDLYFAIGVPFESAWLSKFTNANPEMRIIHTGENIQKKPIERQSGRDKNNYSKNGIKDPHIWLSPPLVMLQARHILTALGEADAANAADYETNYKTFITRLVELDIELTKTFAGVSNPRFMVFHPSWGYFADAYGLRQIAIEIKGKAPKAGDVAELIQTAKQNNIKTIFTQPQFSAKQAQIIAKEIDGRLVKADPLAENWEENLWHVASAIKQELK